MLTLPQGQGAVPACQSEMERIFQDVSLIISCELTIYLPAMAFCYISRGLQKVILDVSLLGDERPRKFRADFPNWKRMDNPILFQWLLTVATNRL